MLTLIFCLIASRSAFAQTQQPKNPDGAETAATKSSGDDASEGRTPAQLFDEADNYTRKKFEAFEKLKMPYDEQLKEKIEKEQRDLAIKYATTLAGRKLSGSDVYYLGLLYNLARNFDS